MPDTIYEMVVTGDTAGQYWQNVQHWRRTADTAPTVWASVLDFAVSAGSDTMWATMLANMSDDTTLRSLRVRSISPTLSPTAFFSFAPGTTGGADDCSNAGVAACLIFTTTAGGRKVGRQFLAGVPDEFVAMGNWNETAYTNYHATGNAIMTKIESDGGYGDAFMVLWDKTAGTAHVVTHNYLSPRISQIRRRRLPY